MKKQQKNTLMSQEELKAEVVSLEPIQGSRLPTKSKAKKKVKQTPSFYWANEGGVLVRRQRSW